MFTAENGQLHGLTGGLKKTKPMTEVQHIQNDQHCHTSFSSNAQNHSVVSEPSAYSAVQTTGTSMIPNALHPETERLGGQNGRIHGEK
ncbi:MAG TPA: hypothetical protein DCF44_11270 [Chitinophagaceae bacterium]|nr:hypothetical protein [Chitinophagaceae bacterium]